MRLISTIIIGTVFASYHTYAAPQKHEYPKFVSVGFGLSKHKNFSKSHPYYLYFSSEQRFENSEDYYLTTGMAGGHFPFRETSSADSADQTGRIDSDLARFDYWIGICAATKFLVSSICTNAGLSFMSWIPLEATNSFIGFKSRLYASHLIKRESHQYRIQMGVDYQYLYRDGAQLPLAHLFLGFGIKIGAKNSSSSTSN